MADEKKNPAGKFLDPGSTTATGGNFDPQKPTERVRFAEDEDMDTTTGRTLTDTGELLNENGKELMEDAEERRKENEESEDLEDNFADDNAEADSLRVVLEQDLEQQAQLSKQNEEEIEEAEDEDEDEDEEESPTAIEGTCGFPMKIMGVSMVNVLIDMIPFATLFPTQTIGDLLIILSDIKKRKAKFDANDGLLLVMSGLQELLEVGAQLVTLGLTGPIAPGLVTVLFFIFKFIIRSFKR